jgi:hypothetical protein
MASDEGELASTGRFSTPFGLAEVEGGSLSSAAQFGTNGINYRATKAG